MLTEVKIRAVKPANKAQKLFDQRGLFLLVMPSGGRLWRFKYRFQGKERLLSLGKYPETSLKMARERRDELRRQVDERIDPSKKRRDARRDKEASLNNTVREVGEACYPKPLEKKPQDARRATYLKPKKPKWKEERRRMEMYVYPKLGDLEIGSVTKEMLGTEINKIIDAGKFELARRVKSACKRVWERAVDEGKCQHNIVADLKNIRSPKGKSRHFASIKDPRRYGDLLRSVSGYAGRADPATQYALKLMSKVFLRPGELRWMLWEWVDFEAAEVRIPPEVMKREDPHIVPLSRQAMELLREVHRYSGHQPFVFPALRSGRPISENTLNCSLRTMGFPEEEMTSHGARSFASTQLYEHQWPGDAIEVQLAHLVQAENEVKAAYNYAKYLPLRRVMMQWWSDYLDALELRQPKPPIPYAAVRDALAKQSFLHDPTIGSSMIAAA